MKLFHMMNSRLIELLRFRDEAAEIKEKIEAAFADRQKLSPADFYTTFFMDSGAPEHVVIGVREVLENNLGADLSRLVDSDDFSKNLEFFWDFDSMADVEIVCELEERFSIKIKDDEAAAAHTVRDIVELVWRKVQGNA